MFVKSAGPVQAPKEGSDPIFGLNTLVNIACSWLPMWNFLLDRLHIASGETPPKTASLAASFQNEVSKFYLVSRDEICLFT